MRASSTHRRDLAAVQLTSERAMNLSLPKATVVIRFRRKSSRFHDSSAAFEGSKRRILTVEEGVENGFV